MGGSISAHATATRGRSAVVSQLTGGKRTSALCIWTLTPGFLLSPFYKDTRVVILSERATRASEGPAFLACANELAKLL